MCNTNEVNLDDVFEAISQIESLLKANWSNGEMFHGNVPDLSIITMYFFPALF